MSHTKSNTAHPGCLLLQLVLNEVQGKLTHSALLVATGQHATLPGHGDLYGNNVKK